MLPNGNSLSETEFLKPTKEILRMKQTSQTQNRFVQISTNILSQTESNLNDYDASHISENIHLANDITYGKTILQCFKHP